MQIFRLFQSPSYSADNHQLKIQFFIKKKSGLLIEEKELNDKLFTILMR